MCIFVRERSLLEAVASCLTELFSPQIITERMAGMLAHYDFITPEIMPYFDKRPPQAERDAHFALDWVKQHARTPEQQQAVVDTLAFKCDVLWCMLDALHYAYVVARADPARRLRAERRRCLNARRCRSARASHPACACISTRRASAWVLLGAGAGDRGRRPGAARS